MYALQRGDVRETIHDCLREHQVDLMLPGQEDAGRVPFYLIEGNTRGSTAKDFSDTYPDATDFQKKMAQRLRPGANAPQKYGLLASPALQHVFAFNRTFADLSPERDRIAFQSPEDVLLSLAGTADLTQTGNFPEVDLGDDDRPSGLDNIIIKYAIVGRGRNANRDPTPNIDFPTAFGRPSLIDRIAAEYAKRPVVLRGQQGRHFLVQVNYKTSTLNDFKQTYTDADDFKTKMAEKLLGENKTNNKYGLILDESLTIVAAFNTAFAQYNPSTREVEVLPVEEALLAMQPGKDLSRDPEVIIPQAPRRFRGWGRGGGAVFKYAIVGKEE